LKKAVACRCGVARQAVHQWLARYADDGGLGRSSVYWALIRHVLIVPGKRGRRREDYRRWERGRSMELWQTNVMGPGPSGQRRRGQGGHLHR
jgi:hypothetical protein